MNIYSHLFLRFIKTVFFFAILVTSQNEVTVNPTNKPTPTAKPTNKPTKKPTVLPSQKPTQAPTKPRWGGCIDTKNPGGLVHKGQSTVICLTLGTGVDWSNGVTNVRYSFKPTVDEYSRFTIPGSYRDIIVNNTLQLSAGDLSVFAASYTQTSFLRVYYDSLNSFIYPHLTAIVDVSVGVVKAVTWDDACVFCKAERCQENTYNFTGVMKNSTNSYQLTKGCYYTKEECDKSTDTNGVNILCDLTLYVAWTGTDAEKKPLFSSGSRFSAFTNKSIRTQLYEALKKNFNLTADFTWILG